MCKHNPLRFNYYNHILEHVVILFWMRLCKLKVAFAENEVEEIETDSCPVLVQESKGDYISEEKSQIVSIVDFRAVPRNEVARQQARRELVIQMLIAESMTN